MSPRDRVRHYRRKRAQSAADLKDRLIQTRVPESLESALKEEARKRRLSVSHLIRNVLEDTFHLVDNVVLEVDNLVQDSMGLARQVRRDAERIASSARGVGGAGGVNPEETAAPEPGARGGDGSAKPGSTASAATAVAHDSAAIAHVIAWNKVVLNAPARCASCGVTLGKGAEAHLGLSQSTTLPATWLCNACLAAL